MPNLNKRQLTILKIFCAYLIITMLFPPFYIGGGGAGFIGLGYGFLFLPPHERGMVNVSQLAAQWFIGVVVFGVMILQSNKYTEATKTSSPSKLPGAMKNGFLRSKLFLVVIASIAIGKAIIPNEDQGKHAAFGLMLFVGYLPIYLAVFIWYAQKAYRGILEDQQEKQKGFSWKRVLMALLLLLIAGSAFQVNSEKTDVYIFDDLIQKSQQK